MSQSTASKRRRETVSSSQASVSTGPPSTAYASPTTPHRTRPRISDVASPPKKKQKDDKDKSVPVVELADEPDLSGGDEATDGGIQAIVSVTRRARRPRILSAEEKRRRFKEKYDGSTPEEILGEHDPTFAALHWHPLTPYCSAIVSNGWRSSVYNHYKAPKIIPGPNGTSVYRFVCKKYVHLTGID